MFNIIAKIGDVVEVTFVNARDGGLMAEETINGRIAFRDRNDKTGRNTDRVRVRIVAENPACTVYFLKTVQVVKLGDGVSTLLQKVRAPIDWREGLYKFDPDGTKKGLAIAQDHFGKDKRKHLEFLMGLLELYSSERDYYSKEKIDWSEAVSAVTALIEQCSFKPEEEAKVWYKLGIKSLAVQLEQKLVYKMLEKANFLAERDSQLEKDTLEALERCFEPVPHTNKCERELIPVLRRLIALHESKGGVDVDRRFRLINHYLEVKHFQWAIMLLGRMQDHVEGLSQSQRAQVYRAYSKCLQGLGDFPGALKEMESAYAEDPSLADELAEVCCECGDFRRAAILYRTAYQNLQGNLQDTQARLENALDDL